MTMISNNIRRCFLVDMENVQLKGLDGVEILTDKDTAYVFFSDAVGKIALKDMFKFINLPCKFNAIELIKQGKNYLDFQLISTLGFLLGNSDFNEFYIVSKDKGMQIAIDNLSKFSTTKMTMISSINDLRQEELKLSEIFTE